MTRLTEHHVDGSGAYMACSGLCKDGDYCFDCKNLEHIINRLAAYEDTGLDPEEITTTQPHCVFYCNRQCNLDGDFCAEGPGCPRELTQKAAMRLLEG